MFFWGFQSLVAHPCLVFVGSYFESTTCQATFSKFTLGGGPFEIGSCGLLGGTELLKHDAILGRPSGLYEMFAEYGWRPHRICVAQTNKLQSSIYRVMREQQEGTAPWNSIIHTVLV